METLSHSDRLNDEGEFRAAEESLPALFARIAATHHRRTALVSASWQPTYGELNATANRLAHAIMAGGAVPGDRVAVLMEHDAPQIAAVLAVLKAGGIIAVLNPTHPPSRLHELMSDADPALVMTDAANQASAGEIAGPRRRMLRFEDACKQGPADDPSVEIDPARPAFLLYTSGSTGIPKGVLQTHRQRISNVVVYGRAMQLTPRDRVPVFSALSAGQGNSVLFSALVHGATALPFPVAQRGVTGLRDWMIEQRITVYVSSASIFRSFMATLNEREIFSRVRVIKLASEPATSEDFRKFQKHFPESSTLLHTLSSSETGNIALSRWSHDDTVPEGRLPVGLVTKDQDILFLDEQGVRVSPGEVGEIVVKSRYMAAGYWRNPMLTAERFSEAGDGSGDRLFRTGDLGRVGADGRLEFCGRLDNRVKIRGNRVELSEVADGLCRLPGVEQAAADIIQRPNNEPALVGYVAVRQEQGWTPARLRRALRSILPDHMVPSRLIMRDRLPLTPGGKIDREKLRQSLPALAVDAAGQPQTPTEALLADLWSEAFELPHVGRHDDFFDLGGDSLIAAVAAARLHDALGIELSFGAVVDDPVLANLAAVIDGLRRADVGDKKPGMVRVPRDGPLPMSLFQERIWAYSRTVEQSRRYSRVRGYRILGPLRPDLLRECFDDLSRRHELLRTSFAEIARRPMQIIHPSAAPSFDFIDFSGAANAEELATVRYRKTAGVFDLTRAPLLHFSLLRLRPDEHWLVRVHHHILSDGWSWRIYFEELAILYQAKVSSAAPALPISNELQYVDYAAWQHRTLGRDSLAYRKSIAWWKAVFSDGMKAADLPVKRRSPLLDLDPSQGRIKWGIAPELSRRLDELARQEGATYFALRLAAFAALLAAETGQPDTIFGIYVSNRNRAALQNMFGYFSNLATFRLHCDQRTTFRAWLREVRRRLVEIEQHSEIPVEDLRAELRKQGVTVPAVRVIFHQSTDQPEIRFAGLTLAPLDQRMTAMPWGFTMDVERHDEEHACRAVFDARLYAPGRVRALIERYKILLDAVARNPNASLAGLLATG